MQKNRLITKAVSFFSYMIALFLIACIRLIRPILGPSNICPFTIGCTPFAIDQLWTQPLHRACINILQRLVQCHPLGNRTTSPQNETNSSPKSLK